MKKKKVSKNKNHDQRIVLSVILILLFVFALYYWVLPFFTRDTYSTAIKGAVEAALAQKEEKPPVDHIETPESMKAIYMSACVAGSRQLRNGLVHIATSTEVNSIIIDVKDFSGKLSFTPDDPSLKEYVSPSCGAVDMKEFVQHLHDNNIYVIGRVTTFQDPFYAKLYPESAIHRKSDGGLWADKNGINYLYPGSKDAWDHVISIAKAAHDIGFDEINFDYIRFPSDGNIADMSIPDGNGKTKPEILESFFEYLHQEMDKSNIVTSADLFGMTTTNYDDLGIGQVLERALPYFDFIAPMVYPSHYPPNFNNWKNPNLVAYDLIHYVMKRGIERTVATSSPIHCLTCERIGTSTPALYTKEVYDIQKLRPWIQDFNYGGTYGPKEVRDQIQASYDVGLKSWLIWSPSNKYTVAGLLPE